MSLNNMLRSELWKLSSAKTEVQAKLVSYPDGELHVWKNGTRFKWVKFEGKKRSLIPKEKSAEAAVFARKMYARCQLEDIERIEAALKRCVTVLEKPSKAEGLYKKPGFYELLAGEGYDAFAKKWEETPYSRSNNKSEYLIHNTLKGDRVRSKAEALIANSLFRAGLPYRYEQEMQMGGAIYYPDFTILSNGREIIWEHMGLLSREEYARANTSKISTFFSFGFFPGDNLIITSENSERPLSANVVERIIGCFLV